MRRKTPFLPRQLPRQLVALFVLGVSLPSCHGQPGGESSTADATTAGDDDSQVASALLTIGSPAPPLNIEHWVSDRHGEFQRVTEFAKGKVYVVEFWATWCGPCVASMPHLAETQSRLIDQGVQLISVSDEDLATVEKFLQRPYRVRKDPRKEQTGDAPEDGEQAAAAESPATYGELTSAYCLTCDPDGSTQRDYMEAAAQNGIPTCFIVGKTGQIEWIGHPMEMNEPLLEVIADKWDRDVYLAEIQREQKRNLMQRELSRKLRAVMGGDGQFDQDAVMKILDEARASMQDDPQLLEQLDHLAFQVRVSTIMLQLASGNYDEADAAWAKLASTASPEQQAGMEVQRSQALLRAREYERAAKALSAYSLQKGAPPEALNALAWGVVEAAEQEDEFSPELLSAAAAAAEKALATRPDDASTLDTLAHLLAAQGELERAILIQEKAVANDPDGNAQLQQYLEELRAR